MNQITTAIYENGILRLRDPVDLQEGEEVKITVRLLDTILVKEQEPDIEAKEE